MTIAVSEVSLAHTTPCNVVPGQSDNPAPEFLGYVFHHDRMVGLVLVAIHNSLIVVVTDELAPSIGV